MNPHIWLNGGSALRLLFVAEAGFSFWGFGFWGFSPGGAGAIFAPSVSSAANTVVPLAVCSGILRHPSDAGP
eukprot:7694660-Pyramimonas_sp.AAC.1